MSLQRNAAVATHLPHPRPVVRAVLREALESTQGGEVVVKSASTTGRIFVVAHRIAWILVLGPEARNFAQVLVDARLVAREEVALVLEECGKSRGNFCEMLVEWGLVPRETLRDLLRVHLAEELAVLLAVRDAQALFVPQARRYSSELTFELAELLPASGAPASTDSTPGHPDGTAHQPQEQDRMASVKQALDEAIKIEGAFAVCLADANSGMSLGSVGDPAFNIEAAAAGNTEVVRAKMKTMKALGIKDRIEDILITLGGQYHVIRPLASREGLFLYIALRRESANLAMARFRMAELEKSIQF